MILLLALLALILTVRDAVRFEIDLWRNVEAEELTEEFVDGAMALPEERFKKAISELWGTGKFIHRQEALTLVGFKLSNTRATSLGEWKPYIAQALEDPDSSLREMALNILVRTTGKGATPQLLAELDNPDHELRIAAMRHLRNLRVTNALPNIAAQLYETNPRLICEAGNWLRRMTGVDLGMKSKFLSRRVLMGPKEAALNDAKLIEAQVRWLTWWEQNSSNWPGSVVPVRPLGRSTNAVALAEFELKNADLSDFDVKSLGDVPVLIYFFTTWKSAAGTEAQDVRAFHERMAGRAQVLGVALDTVPDEHNEVQLSLMFERSHAHHGQAHHHHHDHSGDYEMAYSTEEIVEATGKKISNWGFKFPVVYDTTGRFMNHLNGSEVPVLVMLDANRRVVRRMPGPRREQTLLAVAEAAGAK